LRAGELGGPTVTTATSSSVLQRVELAVLWGAFPILVVCFFWLLSGARPLIAATTFVLVFGLSAGVQVRRALRREGVEREIMLRSAAISYPIVTTSLVLALVVVLVDVVDATTAMVFPLVVALVAQTAVEGILTRRLG
jgi:hypothetical protein